MFLSVAILENPLLCVLSVFKCVLNVDRVYYCQSKENFCHCLGQTMFIHPSDSVVRYLLIFVTILLILECVFLDKVHVQVLVVHLRENVYIT